VPQDLRKGTTKWKYRIHGALADSLKPIACSGN
jgi:hypothetical protein